MPLSAIPQPYLLTLLHQLAMLLLPASNGDRKAAEVAAAATVAGYEPRTEQELRLVVRIIGFSIQAGEALAQAADPAMPLTRVLRLRSGAVSLSREAEKAERALEKLRNPARPGATESAKVQPAVESAPMPAEEKSTIAAYAKAHGLTWTQAYNQRAREKRLAERQARDAKRAAAVIAHGTATSQAAATA